MRRRRRHQRLPPGFGIVGEDGTFTYHWTARADGFWLDGTQYRPFECVTAPGCVAHAAIGQGDTPDQLLSAPLTFAADRQVRTPQLELDPPSPLRDGQSVTVHVRGFPSDLSLLVAQCASGVLSGRTLCSDDHKAVHTSEDGTDDVQITVHRQLAWPPGMAVPPTDCSIPGRCTIAVYEDASSIEGPAILELLETVALVR